MSSKFRVIVSDAFSKHTIIFVFLLLLAVGMLTFYRGLSNEFLGDDLGQILQNSPVHSIKNIKSFFEGGTMLPDSGQTNLSGIYYRPLMTTTFSVLYTLFGANPLPFHLVQLLLHILCALMVFIIFRYFVKDRFALAASVLFLVHPINSQSVYAIASVQEPLFLLFGLLAVWTLVCSKKLLLRQLLIATAFLFLSLLSKESGILFIAISLVYVFISHRKKVLLFAGLLAVMFFLYLVLRINAVGLVGHPSNAPMSNLGIQQRTMHAPLIVAFYFFKLIFPVSLASGYHWTIDSITLTNFYLPLLLLIGFILSILYGGIKLYKDKHIRNLIVYCFFGVWFLLGIAICLQIFKLDFTAVETWLYFPVIGILGLFCAIFDAYEKRFSGKWFALSFAIIVLVLAIRTNIRAVDWKDQFTLARRDIYVAPDNYTAQNLVAVDLNNKGNYRQALEHINKSIEILPNASNYNNKAIALMYLGDFEGAGAAYKSAIAHDNTEILYINLGLLIMNGYGDYENNKTIINEGISEYPNSADLWLYLAVIEYNNRNSIEAKQAISKAYALKKSNPIPEVHRIIMNNLPLNITSSNR